MKTKKQKILFIDSVHPVLMDDFTDIGFKCDYFPEYKKEDYEKIIHEYFGVIIRSKIKLDKHILEKANQLKFIGRVGSGLENIDVEFAEKKAIKCFNSPEGSRDAVGEHALGMILSLLNNLNKADKEVRQGKWNREKNRGTEIKDKTIGIIGYGNMGSAYAEKISGFGAKVIAYDKYKFNYSDKFVTETDIETIFKETDILSLHVPLTEETTYMVDDNFINKFKKEIYLINTSRGKVVKTNDLVKNIQSGKIKGAALDVLEYEDLSYENLIKENFTEAFKFLINSDKVILSPHIAGWTFESEYKLAKVLVDKIKEGLKLTILKTG
jgi:D-3-phosphoglycerate dehydrogenase